MARLDTEGRISLPADAVTILGAGRAGGFVTRGTCNRLALVLDDRGAVAMKVDGRGRLLLPVWLRRAGSISGCVLVGTRFVDHLVVVAPAGVLDDLGDLLAGGTR